MRALCNLSIILSVYWAEMVMSEMVMCRNGSRPKISSHRQIASDTFILKFASVSAFHRRSEIEDAIFVCLNFCATVRCKKAIAEGSSKECFGALRSAFLKHTLHSKLLQNVAKRYRYATHPQSLLSSYST